MGVRFNKTVEVKDIPDGSWDEWIRMGYENPVDYLRETYGATEVLARNRKQLFWREIRFYSRKSYTEFYLTWM
jgi:hypothetical protein